MRLVTIDHEIQGVCEAIKAITEKSRRVGQSVAAASLPEIK